MKSSFFLFFFCFILLNCEKKVPIRTQNTTEISDRLSFMHNEKGVSIQSGENSFFIEQSKLPLKKVILLNASLLGYFIELGIQDRIIGVTSPEYIYNEAFLKNIENGKIQVVGNDQKLNLEKIIALAPDAIFTNYISTHENVYTTLKNNDINIIFLDEYLENTPLQKAAYIKLFGALTNRLSEAQAKFEQIEKNYRKIQQKTMDIHNKKTVMANEMYGNIWYMPAGNSIVSTFIQDAGGKYLLENEKSVSSVSMSFEKVLKISQSALVWVNAGSYPTKKSLLHAQPQYKLLPVFQHGRIYSLQKAQKKSANNFFEEGNVRADYVLKDYAIILQPQLFPSDSLRYFLEIK